MACALTQYACRACRKNCASGTAADIRQIAAAAGQDRRPAAQRLGRGRNRQCDPLDLLESIDDRAAHEATFITSQLPIEHWHAWIGGATVADAILNRIMLRHHRITLTGDSLRQEGPKLASLAENEVNRQSLEDKHRHAYEALEHDRQSVKEQREQDTRRHKQQLQQLQVELPVVQQAIVVKQEEITRLNQEGARLVADLTHAGDALHEAQEAASRTTQRLDVLQSVERRNGEMTAQLADREAQVQALREQLAVATDKAGNPAAQVCELDLALTTANVKFESQQGLVTALRAYLDAHGRQVTSQAS